MEIQLNRPEITAGKLQEIRAVIMENPEWGRTRVSKRLCEMWNWKSPNGQTKDMSCRDMLRDLDKKGAISLPPMKSVSRMPGMAASAKHVQFDSSPVACGLESLQPLSFEAVEKGAALDAFKSYLDQFHYLGFDRTVGENMKYIVSGCGGTPVACMLFGSAAWSCRDRDALIGWGKDQRKRNLSLMTNNTRYLIFPWVTVANLASHILSLAAKRISGDWRAKYGHGLVLLETFVERPRFRGSCYRAANWIHAGCTTGRGRDGGHKHAILPVKDIYLLPLAKDFRARLAGPGAEAGAL